MGLLPDGLTYTMFWMDAEQFTNLTYTAKVYSFAAGQHIIIQHKLLQKPDVYVYDYLFVASTAEKVVTIINIINFFVSISNFFHQ